MILQNVCCSFIVQPCVFEFEHVFGQEGLGVPPRRLKRKMSEEMAYSAGPLQTDTSSITCHENPKSPVGGSLPSVFKWPCFKMSRRGLQETVIRPFAVASTGSAGISVQTSVSTADVEVYDADNCSSEDEAKDPFELLSEKKTPAGVKVYYDYAMDCMVRLHPSGAISPGKASDGPAGFRVFTWTDGVELESEEPNTLPVVAQKVLKKPAGEKPDAKTVEKCDEDECSDATAGYPEECSGEASPQRAEAMASSKGEVETKVAKPKAEAKILAKPKAEAKTLAMPNGGAKASAKPQAEAASASNVVSWTTGGPECYRDQSYIRYSVDGFKKKILLVSVSSIMSENHQSIIGELREMAKISCLQLSVVDAKFQMRS